ncbi:hypothetical protein EZS27_026216 [termite gut metagenome]|uniref:Uncharacterized protein n=1 Tax=termite gut metagenome TaxID=433724 RepID=A0A5J4QUJ4_9ZZZZ
MKEIIEPDVDCIGSRKSLTKEEEQALSDFFAMQKSQGKTKVEKQLILRNPKCYAHK